MTRQIFRQIFLDGPKDGLERVCDDLPEIVEFPRVSARITPGTKVADRLTSFPLTRIVALECYRLTTRGFRHYGPVSIAIGWYRFEQSLPIDQQ